MFENIKYRCGFTLIEMLVVVLIIGILAAVALPQYSKSVEKAKLAEALVNSKAIEESMKRYILSNGFPTQIISFKSIGDVELSGGEWEEGDSWWYNTKNFAYDVNCKSFNCLIEIERDPDNWLYGLETVILPNNTTTHKCVTQLSDIGRYICKHLESQGWEYYDGEM